MARNVQVLVQHLVLNHWPKSCGLYVVAIFWTKIGKNTRLESSKLHETEAKTGENIHNTEGLKSIFLHIRCQMLDHRYQMAVIGLGLGQRPKDLWGWEWDVGYQNIDFNLALGINFQPNRLSNIQRWQLSNPLLTRLRCAASFSIYS